MPDGNSDLRGYLDAIDQADDELLELRSEYMNQCKRPRETIREIKSTAREAGENMRAFGTLLKGHRADRAHAKRVAELEQEDAEAYEAMVDKLGPLADTPLGQASLRKQNRRKRGGDELQA